ncbi:MAG TPA: GAF domain-containing protein [Microbacteriaceae bacterium]|nr:GAF domain-containing protein [Microbacteriaceae bacterium]
MEQQTPARALSATSRDDAEHRLRALLRAGRAVAQPLDLATVLHRIVEAAVDLVESRYGALGVYTHDGTLETFIQVGLTQHEVEGLGPLPTAHRGVVGALTNSSTPIRLRHISDDPRSVGTPPGHPAVDSFLGVPILVRGRPYGNLYLINRVTGEFTQEDEDSVVALAATAGSAIENARLFARAQREREWASAAADATAAALSTDSDPLVPVAVCLQRLCDADLVACIGPRGDVNVLAGTADDAPVPQDALVTAWPAAAKAATAPVTTEEGEAPARPTAASWPSAEPGGRSRPVLLLPVPGPASEGRTIAVVRPSSGPAFTGADLDSAADFAARVGVTLQLAKAHADEERVRLMADRERIARDLHDQVIQQIFAAGLNLQALATTADAETARRLTGTVTALDGAIAQIRSAIFALSDTDAGAARKTTRSAVLDVVDTLADALPRTPNIEFAGPVDHTVTGALEDDVVAVVREGLTNIVKHAAAAHISLAVRVSPEGRVTVDIDDDGVGRVKVKPHGGLDNIRSRAKRHGGSLQIASGAGGTRLHWSVPHLAPRDATAHRDRSESQPERGRPGKARRR